MLACNNLCLQYPDGEKKKTVLNDIHLTINEGEKVVLLGPSGSGKSSLIYLLSSLRKATKGAVFFNDADLTRKNEKETAEIRKKYFGFIFQTHFLLPYLNVIENVLVVKNVMTAENTRYASGVLAQLGLREHIHKKVYQLSGGERQRVAIARAIINEPDILFADEPTASLDHETARKAVAILKNYKKNSILIMATHDTTILSGDEKVIRLTDGKMSMIYP